MKTSGRALIDPRRALMGSETDIALSEELVRRCERPVADRQPRPGSIPLSDGDYETAADDILAKLQGQPLWVFAYGSLIWKPAFTASESRPATLHGWRRSFCLETHSWRGSPEQPGLMLGLKRGGQCNGVVLRVSDGDRRSVLIRLLDRETNSKRGLDSIHIATVETAEGPVRALAFWSELDGGQPFRERDEDTTAQMMARACGQIGSCASYLRETVLALRQHGIHDSYMWRMQEQVAAVISRQSADEMAAPTAIAEYLLIP